MIPKPVDELEAVIVEPEDPILSEPEDPILPNLEAATIEEPEDPILRSTEAVAIEQLDAAAIEELESDNLRHPDSVTLEVLEAAILRNPEASNIAELEAAHDAAVYRVQQAAIDAVVRWDQERTVNGDQKKMALTDAERTIIDQQAIITELMSMINDLETQKEDQSKSTKAPQVSEPEFPEDDMPAPAPDLPTEAEQENKSSTSEPEEILDVSKPPLPDDGVRVAKQRTTTAVDILQIFGFVLLTVLVTVLLVMILIWCSQPLWWPWLESCRLKRAAKKEIKRLAKEEEAHANSIEEGEISRVVLRDFVDVATELPESPATIVGAATASAGTGPPNPHPAAGVDGATEGRCSQRAPKDAANHGAEGQYQAESPCGGPGHNKSRTQEQQDSRDQ